MKYYISNLLKPFIFTSEMNIKTTPGSILCADITVTPQHIKRNHYNAGKGLLLRFGGATF